ncbi:MAG: hypothetical protein AAFR77_14245 [Cyanobacteria bacterium J06631_2]
MPIFLSISLSSNVIILATLTLEFVFNPVRANSLSGVAIGREANPLGQTHQKLNFKNFEKK